MTHILRDCTVNPPRILFEIIELEKPRKPFDPHPQIRMPRSNQSVHPGCLIITIALTMAMSIGILGYLIW